MWGEGEERKKSTRVRGEKTRVETCKGERRDAEKDTVREGASLCDCV